MYNVYRVDANTFEAIELISGNLPFEDACYITEKTERDTNLMKHVILAVGVGSARDLELANSL